MFLFIGSFYDIPAYESQINTQKNGLLTVQFTSVLIYTCNFNSRYMCFLTNEG